MHEKIVVLVNGDPVIAIKVSLKEIDSMRRLSGVYYSKNDLYIVRYNKFNQYFVYYFEGEEE